jgi:hypothetical protein
MRRMSKEDTNTQADFPICVIEIDRSDIESACYEFDEDVWPILMRISWDAVLLNKIVKRLRNQLLSDSHIILSDTIKEVLKDEIEEMKSKRSFLQGLKDYIGGNKTNDQP